MVLCKTECSWAECMPVAWLIATGLLSLTFAFVARLGDANLFLFAIADVDSSPSGGQVTDTANIYKVRLAYNEKNPCFAEWLPCTTWAVVTAVTGLPVVSPVSASQCYQQPSLRTVWHHGGCIVDERHFLATAFCDLAGWNSLGLDSMLRWQSSAFSVPFSAFSFLASKDGSHWGIWSYSYSSDNEHTTKLSP